MGTHLYIPGNRRKNHLLQCPAYTRKMRIGHLILLALDDITLRKEAEKIQTFQSMQQILESMPQITFSANGRRNLYLF